MATLKDGPEPCAGYAAIAQFLEKVLGAGVGFARVVVVICPTLTSRSHPPKPMVDQRGFPDPIPGNDCNDVRTSIHPEGNEASPSLRSLTSQSR